MCASETGKKSEARAGGRVTSAATSDVLVALQTVLSKLSLDTLGVVSVVSCSGGCRFQKLLVLNKRSRSCT